MAKLKVSEELSLPADAVTQTFGILAVRGAGKSNAAVVMAEEMFAAGHHWVAIDPKGDWWGIRSGQDGKAPGLPVVIFGGRHADVPLESTAGALIAQLIVEDAITCVLDVSEFTEGEKIRFLDAFGETLFRRKTSEQSPTHLFLEEADDYIPQRVPPKMAHLLYVFERLVKQGRARGLGATLITQRSAVINKNVLTQIETLIALRTTSPQDRDAIKAWVSYHGERDDILATLPSLPNGDAWVWSPNWLHNVKRVHFRQRATFDSGATPTGALKRRAPATLADIDLDALRGKMAETIERAKTEDPTELRKQIASLKAELAKRPISPPQPDPAAVAAAIKHAMKQAMERLGLYFDGLQDLSHKFSSLVGDMAVEAVRIAGDPSISKDALAGIQKHDSAKRVVEQRIKDELRAMRPARTEIRETVNTEIQKSATTNHLPHIPAGEKQVLTAIAQYPTGATRIQLTALTGYKRSTRDAYIQRLVAYGFAQVSGDKVQPTADGFRALGPEFQPLPTGDALRKWWLDRLPKGERQILEILFAAYPRSVARDLITQQTEFARSSRDAYIQRLMAKHLVQTDHDGVHARPELFE